eukprot:scpid14093/ scgid30539/ Protection of telomeres protein 1; POT1-like telomere end-binding protein
MSSASAGASPSAKRKRHETYSYTKLADLKDGDSKKNFYGVVKCFFPSKKTLGTDWSVHFIVVDPSASDEDNSGLKVVWFGRDQASLPVFKAVGDIVRCHRVNISTYKGRLQCCSKHYINSAIVCFSGEEDASMEPTWFAKSDPVVTDKDKETLAELRGWALMNEDIQQELSGTQCLTLSSVMATDVSFCLDCQVAEVHSRSSRQESRAVLRVWDGTMPAREAVRLFESTSAARNSAGKLIPHDLTVDVALSDSNARAIDTLKAGDIVRLPKLTAQPATADLANTTVKLSMQTSYSPTNEHSFQVLSAEQCSELVQRLDKCVTQQSLLRVRSMESSKTIAGNPWLDFTKISSIQQAQAPAKFRVRCTVADYLPPNIVDMVVLECADCRCHFSCPPPPPLPPRTSRGSSTADVVDTTPVAVDSSASPTCGSHGSRSISAPAGTGSDSPVAASGDSSASTERMMSSGLLSHCGLWLDAKRKQYYCPHCSPRSEDNVALRFIFKFALLLRDASGLLVARCMGPDAEYFFNLQPCDLHLSTATRETIESCMRALVGDEDKNAAEAGRSCRHALVECCLKSYHALQAEDLAKMTRHVSYRITETSYEEDQAAR